MARKSKSYKFRGKNVFITVAELQLDEKELENAMNEIGEETSKIVQQKAPGSGNYKKGIYHEFEFVRGAYIVRVKAKQYRLVHLLEFGHIIENQYGVYGKTRAQPHFRNGQKYLKEELVAKIQEKEIIF